MKNPFARLKHHLLGSWRGDYWVAEDDRLVGGNLSRAFALDYARGQSSLHPKRMYIVARTDAGGTLHVEAIFPR